jgi:hypothetical protein
VASPASRAGNREADEQASRPYRRHLDEGLEGDVELRRHGNRHQGGKSAVPKLPVPPQQSQVQHQRQQQIDDQVRLARDGMADLVGGKAENGSGHQRGPESAGQSACR